MLFMSKIKNTVNGQTDKCHIISLAEVSHNLYFNKDTLQLIDITTVFV